MLAVERGTSLVFRAHNPLNRCKVQLAKRIVLITEQTLSSSTVLDGVGPGKAYGLGLLTLAPPTRQPGTV